MRLAIERRGRQSGIGAADDDGDILAVPPRRRTHGGDRQAGNGEIAALDIDEQPARKILLKERLQKASFADAGRAKDGGLDASRLSKSLFDPDQVHLNPQKRKGTLVS